MTVTFTRNASGVRLVDDAGRTTFDTELLPAATLPTETITVTGLTIAYGDLVKDNAQYWSGSGAPSNPVTEVAISYVTAIKQDWGPLAASPYTLPDILLGTVPAETDYLDIACVLTRTVNPDAIFGDTLPPIPKMGKTIRLRDCSCLLEEAAGFVRGFFIVRVADPDPTQPQKVYLRRSQSYGTQNTWRLGGRGGWSPTNSATDNDRVTYGSVKGSPVALIQAISGSFFSGGVYTHRRGNASAPSLTDTTNFSSTYTADFVIIPGLFDTDPDPTPPATVKGLFAGFALQNPSTATANFSFANVPLLQPATSRKIVVMVQGGNVSSSGRAVSSMTIGGVAATKVVETVSTSTTTSIWIATVPTGDLGTVAMTFAGAMSPVSITAFALYNSTTSHGDASGTLTTSSPGFAVAGLSDLSSTGLPSQNLAGIAGLFNDAYQAGSSAPIINCSLGYQDTDGTTLHMTRSGTSSNAFAAASFG